MPRRDIRPVFSADGKLVAIGDEIEDDVLVCSSETGEVVARLPGARPLGFDPAAKRLLISGGAKGPDLRTGRLRIYDVGTGRLTFDTLVNRSEILSGAISPDGAMLACGGEDHAIRVISATTGKIEHSMLGHTNDPLSIVFSPDRKSLISCAADGTVRIWDPAKGSVLRVLNNHNFDQTHCLQVCLLSDGKRLAAAGFGPLNIWDLATGKLMLQIPRSKDQSSIVQLPDGDLLSVGSSGELYRLGTEPVPPLAAEDQLP
jgi:WD40 repeat protein